jgi:hypothetical protein
MTTKRTYKRRALGNAAAVVADSPSVAEAARRLRVNPSSIFRWIRAGIVPRPGALAEPAAKANVAAVQTFTIAEAIGDTRPDDPACVPAWLALRSEMFRACVGTPFDSRHVLSLDGAALADWRARRLEWLRQRFAGDVRVC